MKKNYPGSQRWTNILEDFLLDKFKPSSRGLIYNAVGKERENLWWTGRRRFRSGAQDDDSRRAICPGGGEGNDLRARRPGGRARWKLTADGIEYRVSGIVGRGMENADVDRNRG